MLIPRPWCFRQLPSDRVLSRAGSVENRIVRNGMRSVTCGGWGTLCSSGITFVRGTSGHARHPFEQVPPVSGSCGPIHTIISEFLMLAILLDN